MALSTFLASRGCEVALIVPVQVLAVRRLKGLDRVKNDRLGVRPVAEAQCIGQFYPTRLATDEALSLHSLTRYRQALNSELAEVKAQYTRLPDFYFPEFSRRP